MPRKRRSSLGKLTPAAKRLRLIRKNETLEDRTNRLNSNKERGRQRREHLKKNKLQMENVSIREKFSQSIEENPECHLKDYNLNKCSVKKLKNPKNKQIYPLKNNIFEESSDKISNIASKKVENSCKTINLMENSTCEEVKFDSLLLTENDAFIPNNLNSKQEPVSANENVNMDLIMECSEEQLTPTELNAYKQIEQNDDSIMKKLLHSSTERQKYPSVQNISSLKDCTPNEISNLSNINIPLNSNDSNVSPLATSSNSSTLNKTFIITPLTTPVMPFIKPSTNPTVNSSKVPTSGLITTNMIIGTNTFTNAVSKMPIIYIPNKLLDMKQLPTVITKVEKPVQLVQTPSHSQLPFLLPAIKTSDNPIVNQQLIPILTINEPSLPITTVGKTSLSQSNPVPNKSLLKNNLCKVKNSNTDTVFQTVILAPLFPVTKNGTTGIYPAKSEPAKVEPAKSEPIKLEPAKSEPDKSEPDKSKPAKPEFAKKCERKPKKFTKELTITIESLAMRSMMCYECSNYLSATHFGRFLNCGSCNYSTYCSKAFVNHMIYTHSKLKNVHKVRNLKPVYLNNPATCDCSFLSFDGNSVARHLVKCKKLSCKVIWKNDRTCTKSEIRERISQLSSKFMYKNLREKISRQEKKDKIVKIKKFSSILKSNISKNSKYHHIPITDDNIKDNLPSCNQEKRSDECLDILETSESSFQSVSKTECSSPKNSPPDIEIMEEESLYFEIEETTSNISDEIEIIDNQ